MLIGEMARRAGTSTRTLRYYEEHGLLAARRGANGYRVYDTVDVSIVRNIRALLDIGLGVEDIRPFVACLRAGNPVADACPDSVAVLRRRLDEVDRAIDDLAAVRDRLRRRLADAAANPPTQCRASRGARS
jgi:DNA-binding transcriptional MerR regulator